METEFVLASWITSSIDNECDLIVRSPGAVFYLQWIPSELERAPLLLADFLKSLDILKLDYGQNTDDVDEDMIQAEVKKLQRPFNEILLSLAPNPPMPPFTLDHWINPQWFVLVATADESDKIRPRREYENPYMPTGEPRQSISLKGLDLEKWVPNWYSSHEVQIMPSTKGKNPFLFTPTKVQVRGNIICHFKGIKCNSPTAIRELKTHRQILDALAKGRIPVDFRVCRLHGVVYDKSDNNERIVGLLLLHIKTKISDAPSTLADIAFLTKQETCQRWSKELAKLVHTLHNAGIQWGDAKPDNVLVDENDDLWLIDFGGGYTPTWVSRQNCGKLEGDIEGLKNSQAWLSNIIDKSCH